MSKSKDEAAKLIEALSQAIREALTAAGLDVADVKTFAASGSDALLPSDLTPEEIAEADARMEAEVATLLASTDIKQAIINKLEEAHKLMHEVGPLVALASRMTDMLEPCVNPALPDQTEERAVSNLKSWTEYLNTTLKFTAGTQKALCYASARFAADGTESIPGQQKGDTVVAPDSDFSQFIGKLMPPGEA